MHATDRGSFFCPHLSAKEEAVDATGSEWGNAHLRTFSEAGERANHGPACLIGGARGRGEVRELRVRDTVLGRREGVFEGRFATKKQKKRKSRPEPGTVDHGDTKAQSLPLNRRGDVGSIRTRCLGAFVVKPSHPVPAFMDLRGSCRDSCGLRPGRPNLVKLSAAFGAAAVRLQQEACRRGHPTKRFQIVEESGQFTDKVSL